MVSALNMRGGDRSRGATAGLVSWFGGLDHALIDED